MFDVREEADSKRGAIAQVADRLDINRETLRNWVRAAEIDRGEREGLASDERVELKARCASATPTWNVTMRSSRRLRVSSRGRSKRPQRR